MTTDKAIHQLQDELHQLREVYWAHPDQRERLAPLIHETSRKLEQAAAPLREAEDTMADDFHYDADWQHATFWLYVIGVLAVVVYGLVLYLE